MMDSVMDINASYLIVLTGLPYRTNPCHLDIPSYMVAGDFHYGIKIFKGGRDHFFFLVVLEKKNHN